MTKWPLGLLN